MERTSAKVEIEMDDETAHAILDVQAETIALRVAVKMLLRRTYGMGDQVLSVIREDALANVETELDQIEADERQRYFRQSVREAITDLLTPLSR